ncbi:GDF9 factor, partial [Thryothorus ludovicianus]|nr:GDF9 factor [Thryothorus ludovicianus]
MTSPWRICVCLYCCLPWLCAGTQQPGGREGSAEGILAAAEDAAGGLSAVLQLPQGGGTSPALLPPLLKVLHGEAPRLPPNSRALRYMKRLYRMSATRDGIPREQRGRLYNTVRLFTPCWECERGGAGQGDVHSVDLLFSLDRVTALE